MLFMLVSYNAHAAFPVKDKKADIETISTTNDITADSADAVVASSGKSQLTAVLLALFLGGLGIHRFYLGYTWQGVVQLLTAGGFGIWALIDLIRIITGDLQPKNGSYSKTL